MAEPKIESRLCEYKFSEAEKKEIAATLANGVSELQRLEERKKQLASQLKSEVDGKQAAVNLAAEQLRSGFEMRSIDCEVVYSYIDDQVRWIRTDTGEVAHERKMRPDERQLPVLPDEITDAVIDAAERGEAEGLRPKKGSGIDSITLESGSKKVTLHAK
jgi:hypothetical protein